MSWVNCASAAELPWNKSLLSNLTVVPVAPKASLMAFTTRCTLRSLEPDSTRAFLPAAFKSFAAALTAASTPSESVPAAARPLTAFNRAVATLPCSDGLTMER